MSCISTCQLVRDEMFCTITRYGVRTGGRTLRQHRSQFHVKHLRHTTELLTTISTILLWLFVILLLSYVYVVNLWTCYGGLLWFAHCSNGRSSILVKHWSSFSRQYRIYLSTVQICVHQTVRLTKFVGHKLCSQPDWLFGSIVRDIKRRYGDANAFILFNFRRQRRVCFPVHLHRLFVRL